MSSYPAVPATLHRRSPFRFFLLVAVLSVPFAWLGASGRELFPAIPISALAFVCPVTAACLLRYREDGATGVRDLLRRPTDLRRLSSTRCLVPVLLLMPAVTAATYLTLWSSGRPIREPWFPWPGAVLLFLVFVVAALGEELGWSGYALDPMQECWGELRAAVLLGAVGALWHVVAMVQAGQSPAWIAWGCLDMVATRVLMVWIYNGTGRSVSAVALYHAVANLSIKAWFPGGSYEAERIISVLLVGLAVLAITSRRRVPAPGQIPSRRPGPAR